MKWLAFVAPVNPHQVLRRAANSTIQSFLSRFKFMEIMILPYLPRHLWFNVELKD